MDSHARAALLLRRVVRFYHGVGQGLVARIADAVGYALGAEHGRFRADDFAFAVEVECRRSFYDVENLLLGVNMRGMVGVLGADMGDLEVEGRRQLPRNMPNSPIQPGFAYLTNNWSCQYAIRPAMPTGSFAWS